MAKKGKPQKTIKPAAAQPPDEPIGALGWRLIGAGAFCAVVGFFVLSKADPMGRNWASTLSPFLILGGYALVGVGIFVPDAAKGENPSSAPPAQP